MQTNTLKKLEEAHSQRIFTQGKYYGKTHKEVVKMDPQYILDCYEGMMDNGGISRETYRLAACLIGEDE